MQAALSEALAALTHSASGGTFMFQAFACFATNPSTRGRAAAISIGGGLASAGRTRARSSETKRPRALTSSPRQSARTALRDSSSQAMRSAARGHGKPKRWSASCAPIERNARKRPGAMRSNVASDCARRAAFQ